MPRAVGADADALHGRRAVAAPRQAPQSACSAYIASRSSSLAGCRSSPTRKPAIRYVTLCPRVIFTYGWSKIAAMMASVSRPCPSNERRLRNSTTSANVRGLPGPDGEDRQGLVALDGGPQALRCRRRSPRRGSAPAWRARVRAAPSGRAKAARWSRVAVCAIAAACPWDRIKGARRANASRLAQLQCLFSAENSPSLMRRARSSAKRATASSPFQAISSCRDVVIAACARLAGSMPARMPSANDSAMKPDATRALRRRCTRRWKWAPRLSWRQPTKSARACERSSLPKVNASAAEPVGDVAGDPAALVEEARDDQLRARRASAVHGAVAAKAAVVCACEPFAPRLRSWLPLP